MTPVAHIVTATVLTVLRVCLLAVTLLDLAVAVILWLPPDAPWPSAWGWQALAAAGGYVIASLLFWLLGRIPVKRRRHT